MLETKRVKKSLNRSSKLINSYLRKIIKIQFLNRNLNKDSRINMGILTINLIKHNNKKYEGKPIVILTKNLEGLLLKINKNNKI